MFGPDAGGRPGMSQSPCGAFLLFIDGNLVAKFVICVSIPLRGVLAVYSIPIKYLLRLKVSIPLRGVLAVYLETSLPILLIFSLNPLAGRSCCLSLGFVNDQAGLEVSIPLRGVLAVYVKRF